MSMINTQRHEDSKLEFSLLMWLAFAVFFVAIAMTRLVPRAACIWKSGSSAVASGASGTWGSSAAWSLVKTKLPR